MVAETHQMNGKSTSEHFIAKSRIHAAVRAEITKNNVAIEHAIGTALGTLLREVEERLASKLEEAMKEFIFKGAWTEGKRYRQRNFVSIGGAVYYCNADTDTRPGTSDDWSLLVPKPRDGKDGKDFTPPPPLAPGGPRSVRSQR